ncbi:MAG: DUF4190 domain-containing protein [Trebonia sp.]
MTSDPGPGSDEFSLPPSSDSEPETRPNGQPGPAPNGQFLPYNGQFHGQPPYGPPAYGPPSYGPVPPYGPVSPYGQAPYGQAPYGQAPYGQVPYGQLPYGQPGAVHPGMLTAAADRERTMDVLKAAYGEGRITKEEFDLRAGRAMGARTYAQLAAVVADLPAGPHLGVMPFQPGYYPAVNTPTSGLAIGSLVCGILEIFTLGFAAIPAVILGHLARNHIRQTGERGDGMAIAGLVLGYLGIGIWTLIIIALAARPQG